MATFELYTWPTIGMCLTEMLNEMVSGGTLSPGLAIQVLAQLDKSMTEALENQMKSKVTTVKVMATFEMYRRSSIGMCLTETLDEMVSSGILSPKLAIQVLVQFDESMTEAFKKQVKSKSKVTVKSCCGGHDHVLEPGRRSGACLERRAKMQFAWLLRP